MALYNYGPQDITRCSGVEYYPFYRECWLYARARARTHAPAKFGSTQYCGSNRYGPVSDPATKMA